jgi:hypothetical protein
MRTIAWVDVIERDPESDDDSRVIQSYPFPDLDILGYKWLTLNQLRNLIDEMEDEITKECYHTRLHFIMNRWHPKNFVSVELKNWKYK